MQINKSDLQSESNKIRAIEKKAIKIWVLRILMIMDGNIKFIGKHFFDSNEIARLLNLEKISTEEYDCQIAFWEISSQFEFINKNTSGLPKNTVLSKNIKKIAKAFSLTTIESQILHFTALVKTNPILGEAIDLLGFNKPSVIARLYANCLSVEPNLVAQALKHDGNLNKTGLLTLEEGTYYSFDSKVNILDGLLENIDIPTTRPIVMFKSSFCLTSPAKLSTKHYPHLNDDIELLKRYINVVQKTRKLGTNILIYGPPGVGKTEFVKMLAKTNKSILYEIGFEGSQGKPLNAVGRFKAYKTAQCLLKNNNKNIVLFDEVEDVFSPRFDTSESTGNNSGRKAWVNKILEENPVPAFWLTNHLSSIDKAFIRRFDYVLEIKAPPKDVRSEMIESYLSGLPVSPAWKNQMAKYDSLPPGAVERASNMLRIISDSNPTIDADKSIHRIIGNSLEAMRMPRTLNKTQSLELDYKVDMLNADCNMFEVSEGIIKNGQARVCLYGPPGTGKSAFGRYIADMSRKQLMVKKASDIISPYLGESESNMAKMFHEATERDAILLLDEADTYLQDRKKLQRSWEISGVNEMLSQIEAFDGVFICSTNLMDSLDSAALRRFDLKIKFGYLNKMQAWDLFQRSAVGLSVSLDRCVETKLNSLNMLSPGDFAAVLRQSRFRPIKDSWDLYSRLESECNIKPEGQNRKIGFH